ncbi:MAG: glycosyltransferase [Planctomycetota bacterium]
MRLLQVTPYYHPALAFGGPATKVKTIAEWLVQRGHQVTVLTSSMLAIDRVLSRHSVHAQVRGVSILYCAAPLRYRSVGFHPDALAFARRQVASFDVIHIYGYYHALGPVVAARAWQARVPYVLEPLGAFRPIGRSWLKKQLYHGLVGARMARRARRVVATSAQERDELCGAGLAAARIVLRRNGVDLDAFARLPPRGELRTTIGIGEPERVALFLGRLCAKKGIDVLMRGFARHARRHRLIIAGPVEDAAYEQRLRQLALELAIERRVHFVGALYGRDRLAALRDADLLVLPSHNENFGNVVAEAIAANLPVVISEHCGIAPLVQDRAGRVVALTPDAVGQAMAHLLDDEELRARMRRRCPEVASGLAWHAPLCELEALYGQLASERETSGTA